MVLMGRGGRDGERNGKRVKTMGMSNENSNNINQPKWYGRGREGRGGAKRVMMISCSVRGRAGTSLSDHTCLVHQTDRQTTRSSVCIWGVGGHCPFSFPYTFLSSFLSFHPMRCPFIPSCPLRWTSLGLVSLSYLFSALSSRIFIIILVIVIITINNTITIIISISDMSRSDDDTTRNEPTTGVGHTRGVHG